MDFLIAIVIPYIYPHLNRIIILSNQMIYKHFKNWNKNSYAKPGDAGDYNPVYYF